MVKKGYTQQRLANELHISESTIIRKIKRNSFTVEEAKKIILILDIENPADIFFTASDT